MVNLKAFQNCKICGQLGKSFFSIKYSEPKVSEFFETYYGKNSANFLTSYLKDEKFTILKCFQCNFIWQKLAPDNNLSYTLYEKIIDKNKSLEKSKLNEKNNLHKYKNEFDNLCYYYNKQKFNILDYGAGWGGWLNCLDKHRANLYAYELSKTRKNHLINNGINVVENLNNNKYKNFFDYIRLEQVLEHLDEISEILNTIKNISKKNTIIEIGVPNGINQINNNKIEITKGPIQPLEHINCFSNKSLIKLINKNGFRILNFVNIFKFYSKNYSLNNFKKFKLISKDFYKNLFSTTIKIKIRS